MAPDEIEPAILQLRAAVVGEFLDEPPFPFHNRPGVEARIVAGEAEFGRTLNRSKSFGGFEERFARHAATQDAEAADFAAALDHCRFQSQRRSRPRPGVSRTAAAEDEEIVIHQSVALSIGRETKIPMCLLLPVR